MSKELHYIICQTIPHDIEDIRKRMAEHPIATSYFSNPFDALPVIHRERPQLVVTGDVFYPVVDGKAYPLASLAVTCDASYLAICPSLDDLKYCSTGDGFARCIHEASPETLVLRLSRCPSAFPDIIAGDLLKEKYAGLAVITDDSFKEALSKKDRTLLPRNDFVHWYRHNFPEGWK